MPSVLFDSDALINVLSGDLWKSAANRLREERLSLVIAPDVYSQLLAGGCAEAVVERFYRLGLLCEKLGSHGVSFAAVMFDFFASELKGGTRATPRMQGMKIREHVGAWLQRPKMLKFHAKYRADIEKELNKEAMYLTDSEVADLGARPEFEGDREKVIRLLKCGYADRVDDSHWLTEKFLARMKSDTSVGEVVSNSARYRSLRAFAFYGDLITLSAAARSYKPHGLWTVPLDRGNWLDARIAATASYCTLLVSDDRRMRRATRFLSPCLHAYPPALSLVEFFKGL